MILRADNPAIPRAGKAQNGWIMLVHWSPQAMAMAERPEFAAMPRYPDDGSVQIIDGCLVVKVQEEYTPKSDFEIAYENRR
mgnify:CR=1 FL=1